MLRRLVERATRGLVLRRSLPAEFRGQSLYVSPDARLAYLFQSLGRAEKKLLEWAKEWVGRGDSVWDVGANCGVFAVASAVLAEASGNVLAVEADPFLAGLLRRSGEQLRGPDARFEVLEVAVTESCGRATFHVARRGRASNWVAGSSPSSQAGGFRSRLEVETVSLDSLLERFRPPTVVKIDVEGSESRVLAGAERLLAEVRPVLLLEVSAPCRERVTKRLRELSYQLFDAELNPSDRFHLDQAVTNTLALPGRPLSS